MKKILFAALFTSISSLLFSQIGGVKGKVVNGYEALPFVLLSLEDQEITTNQQGEFVFRRLLPGKHTLTIRYLGYGEVYQEVEVIADSLVSLPLIRITAASVELEEVVVQSTIRSGEQKSLNRQKNADGIMNVVSADGIGKLPDRNAAEAVQRLPGVAIARDQGEGRFVLVRGTPSPWSSTLFNGDRLPTTETWNRATELDLVPTELIESIELSKALTPDMEGDAIGGSINYITKTAPDKKILAISLSGGAHQKNPNGILNGSITFGDRKGKLGYFASGAMWSRNWGSHNYEVSYDNESFAIRQLQLRNYWGTRTTYGFNGGVDFRISEKSKLYVKGMFTDFIDDEKRHKTAFRFSDADSLGENGSIEFGVSHTVYRSQLYGGEVGWEKNTSKLDVDFKLSSYRAVFKYDSPIENTIPDEHGYYIATFKQSGVQFGNFSPLGGAKYLATDAPDGIGDVYNNIQPYTTQPLSPEQAILDNIRSSNRDIVDSDYAAKIDVKYDHSTRLKIKTGLKYKLKDRYTERHQTFWTSNVPLTMGSLNAAERTTNFLPELNNPYNAIYPVYPTIKEVDNLINRSGVEKEFRDKFHPDQIGENLYTKERICAGYLMGNYLITDKVKVIAGFRAENTSIDYTSYERIFEENKDQQNNKINRKNAYFSLLPMVHLKSKVKDNWFLRAAITRTFSRPDYGAASPSQSIDHVENQISRGNINLRSVFSWNYDLMTDLYFENVGIFSFGVFYKNISDIIFWQRSSILLEDQLFTLSQPENAEKAWLGGVEINFIKRFKIGLGINANYTFIESRMQHPDRIGKHSIPGQARNIWNFTLFYEKNKVSLRLASTMKGRYLDEFQGENEHHDRWYDQNINIDFTGTYNIGRRVKTLIEINNLLNQPLRYYHGVNGLERPEQAEWYGLRGQVGIRIVI